MSDVWIERFQKEALPRIGHKFKLAKVMIFGSRITGGATETSDLDVIIVSVDFGKIPFVKRMGELLRTARFPKHVDYFCYTPEEFDRVKKSSTIIEEAVQQGIEVKM